MVEVVRAAGKFAKHMSAVSGSLVLELDRVCNTFVFTGVG